MKKYTIALALFLTACGMEDKNSNSQNDLNPVQGGAIVRQADTKEVVIEYRKEGGRMAISLADTADLPLCNNANSSQLAYIKSVNKFFECSNSTWSEITLQGDIGNGPSDASKTKSNTEVRPLPKNGWEDPISGSEWLIGGIVSQESIAVQPPCTGIYRLPTQAELAEGLAHGLAGASAAFGTYPAFWASEMQTEPYVITDILTHVALYAAGQNVALTRLQSFGAACIVGK